VVADIICKVTRSLALQTDIYDQDERGTETYSTCYWPEFCFRLDLDLTVNFRWRLQVTRLISK